mmetsp:Transcript_58870/g.157721  ORF Transcript_58870/g.157721 Transcript_58870/m.157721 type:complete len:231 (-) Transcript_58870:336-1028(-)
MRRACGKRTCHLTLSARTSAKALAPLSPAGPPPTAGPPRAARPGSNWRMPSICTARAALPLVDWPSRVRACEAASPSAGVRSALDSSATLSVMAQIRAARAWDCGRSSSPASWLQPAATTRAAAESASSSLLVMPGAFLRMTSNSLTRARKACSLCSRPVTPTHGRTAWLAIHSAMPKRCTVPSTGPATSACRQRTASFQRAKLPSSWEPAKLSSHSTTWRLAMATRASW